MVRTYSREARRNLKRGAAKMEQKMSEAARIRREFQLGRRPKVDNMQPLHPAVVWQKATEALSTFRTKMEAANLKPEHAEALIVYVERTDPDKPRVLLLEQEGKTSEKCRTEVFKKLSSADALALGMVFSQYDETAKKRALFPYLLMPLNARGMDVLKKAAADQFIATELLKNVN